MSIANDHLAHWLLTALELETRAYHIGHYSGFWRNAPGLTLRGGFHAILRGRCWLHLPQTGQSIALEKGDVVLCAREFTHWLSSSASPDDPCLRCEVERMSEPVDTSLGNAVVIAHAQFELKSGLSALVLDSFPDYVVIRNQQAEFQAAKPIFDAILDADSDSVGVLTPLFERITDITIFCAIRQLADTQQIAVGLCAAVQSAEFAPVVTAVINEPDKNWRVEKLADCSQMSPAAFSKRFNQVAGKSPNFFVSMVRMKAAAQLLRQGKPIAQVADKVGYHSESAFSKAFKKMVGQYPGAYQKNALCLNKSQDRLN